MKLNFFLFFTLSIAIFSCSSDDSKNPQDNNTLLKKIIETDIDDEVITTNYNYDGNKLLSIISSDDYKTEYTYDNNKLTRVDSYRDGEQNAYTILTYNENGGIASYILHIIGDNTFRYDFQKNVDNTVSVEVYIGDLNSQTTLNRSYTMTYKGQNILKEVETDYELSYEYDDKNGPYRNIHSIGIINLLSLDFGGLESYSNNTTKKTDIENGFTTTKVYEYTYKNDYPKIVECYNDGKFESSKEYFY
ncbi:hypothetical protein A8C32_02670 [Flavivirga aquatica]|uniref:DUF4595 domain-containing protein n=1 Tax=Flavivirga aquatica TaxID=1849968 RepID=A0A1E5TAG3_9FLAO|nr:hypothetical protein [Flavivirga aquatica]OEK08372.1 hypothetical protein A8C32_02670 [Flavivirga aquatica]